MLGDRNSVVLHHLGLILDDGKLVKSAYTIKSRIHRSEPYTLNRISGGENGQETISIAVCEMDAEWNESATYNSPTGNSAGWVGLVKVNLQYQL